MKIPPCLNIQNSLAYRFKKSLYGLKQAHRAWYAKLSEKLINGGYKLCKFDNSIFILKTKRSFCIIAIYIDDIIIMRSDDKFI